MTQLPMTQPVIITVAITGSLPRKENNPAVPITVVEQIESTQAAFEAGATLCHAHVRNDDQTPTSDPEKFARLKEGLEKHCPGMIIQLSTGGRSGSGAAQRGGMLYLAPDMASLSTGTVNFPITIYENHPTLIRELASKMLEYNVKPEIEVFDLSMLYSAIAFADEGLIPRPLHVQFVLGVKNALPARREILEFEVAQLRALEPTATWTAAGIGKDQLTVNRWALEMGGHCRTGLEDNIRFDKHRLAASNAELVARVAALTHEYGKRPATAAEARSLLGLRPVPGASA